jgi:hypothetical protein
MGIVHSDQFRKSKVPGPATPTKVAAQPTNVASAAR